MRWAGPPRTSDAPRHLVFANFALGHEAAFRYIPRDMPHLQPHGPTQVSRTAFPVHSSLSGLLSCSFHIYYVGRSTTVGKSGVAPENDGLRKAPCHKRFRYFKFRPCCDSEWSAGAGRLQSGGIHKAGVSPVWEMHCGISASQCSPPSKWSWPERPIRHCHSLFLFVTHGSSNSYSRLQ
jgi:hypothetical protein